jgi:inorganic phosphate transporter, PiT family
MDTALVDVVLIIVVGLVFDFTNGFHDSANAIAAPVVTKAVPPRVAALGAAVLNVIGAFASLEVAKTVGSGIVDSGAVTPATVLVGLVAAVAWNMGSWRVGLPTSSSFALIGGLMGAAVVQSGFGVLNGQNFVDKVLIPAFSSPAIGFAIAALLVLAMVGPVTRWMTRRRQASRGIMIATSVFVAYSHGANDAQKTMGIIGLALVAGGFYAEFTVPVWVILLCALAMGIGTYVGGWRIVETLGKKIVRLDMQSGIAVQASTAGVLYSTAMLGFPVSTTQVVTGAVLGSGSRDRWRLTNWGVMGRIVVAWVVTIPATMLVAAALEALNRAPGGDIMLYIVLAIGAVAFVIVARPLFVSYEEEEAVEPELEASGELPREAPVRPGGA